MVTGSDLFDAGRSRCVMLVPKGTALMGHCPAREFCSAAAVGCTFVGLIDGSRYRAQGLKARSKPGAISKESETEETVWRDRKHTSTPRVSKRYST
jgi:hypothetical protein